MSFREHERDVHFFRVGTVYSVERSGWLLCCSGKISKTKDEFLWQYSSLLRNHSVIQGSLGLTLATWSILLHPCHCQWFALYVKYCYFSQWIWGAVPSSLDFKIELSVKSWAQFQSCFNTKISSQFQSATALSTFSDSPMPCLYYHRHYSSPTFSDLIYLIYIRYPQ